MAMGETIVAAVSGISGAGIGAFAALRVQRAKRRDDAEAVSAAQQRADTELTLEILATARAAARAWFLFVEQTLAGLEGGRSRPSDLELMVQVRNEVQACADPLYRLAGRPKLPYEKDERAADHPPFVDSLTEISNEVLRLVVRHAETPATSYELQALSSRALVLRRNISDFLIKMTEAATGQTIAGALTSTGHTTVW